MPLFLAAVIVCGPVSAWAQLGDEEDFPPGLLAKYSAGGRTLERIDAAVAFDWGKKSPDTRLPEGPFSANWRGTLLVRTAGTYQVHAFAEGKVHVKLDGQTVLQGANPQEGWISGKPFPLNFGDQEIQIEYEKTTASARLQLFWSSDGFSLEPLPALLLFREEGQPALQIRQAGGALFRAHRCNRCHRRDDDPLAPPAPSLDRLANGIDPSWLIQKIQQPHETPAANMPSFGFSEQQAANIAAALLALSEEAKFPKLNVKDENSDAKAGRVLFRSTGCLACHTRDGNGQNPKFGGGDLTKLGEKRTAAWIAMWLKSPKTLNADHRMPIVKLSDAERRQLAVYLSAEKPSSSRGKKEISTKASAIASGQALLKAARCTACHRIDNSKDADPKLPDLSKPRGDWNNSCLVESPDVKTWRPAFPTLKPEEKDAIKSYVASRQGPHSPLSEYEHGRLVLEQNNCLSCHERNHAKGIVETAGRMANRDPELQGQSEALIPPALNAVGDKLLDKALLEAVAGEQSKPRLPWLKVRMPKFEHSDEERRVLAHFLQSQDRVPDDAPVPAPAKRIDKADALVAGHTLVGAKGFSCVACHRVGSFEPRNVALGTRGSDLLRLGRRMRKSFYLRWTQSPQRIVPGMEMPSIRKAVPGVLDEQIRSQLEATWEALNDPKFTAPTSPSAVEQFLAVQPGEPARIVRDVFTREEANGGGYVARAMAIGLNNGHSLLIDLDEFVLQNWTFGDFARQRTEGKSWYWDLAGVPVIEGIPGPSDVVLAITNESGDPRFLLPKKKHNTRGRLLSYANTADGVMMTYDLSFETSTGKSFNIHVEEAIRPENQNGTTGWRRSFRFQNIPAGLDVYVSRGRFTSIVGNAKIAASDSDAKIVERAFPGDMSGSPVRLVRAEGGKAELIYSARLTRPALKLPPEPVVVQEAEAITTVPGFAGKRLPLPGSIMPTALAWTDRELPGIPQGTLVFTSLKGHVHIARDTDGDGLEDSLSSFEEGLAAPYGVLPYENGFLVAHKPEVVYLEDGDGDGRADVRRVVATGWGYSDNYHDWTTSLVRDSRGRFYVGLGSDYAQPKRPKETSRWRGDVLRISPPTLPESPLDRFAPWTVEPVGHAFRYPTGLAINAEDEIFVTDNQGVQNTFNEINHLVMGRHYGVPSRHETNRDAKAFPPAIQVPHPWTRSVNGLFFLPSSGKNSSDPFAGQGIGCEYDSRFLIRFTLQKVAGEYQGASYYFSRPNAGVGGNNFQGPLAGGVAPNGDVYIASIHDSGWLGGQNTGDIVRLQPGKNLPNGIREIRATPTGFDVEFVKPIAKTSATKPENYDISGYTREWKGGYATPDSHRHKLDVESVKLSEKNRVASLTVPNRREGYVYEIRCGALSAGESDSLFPDAGHYTLHRIPKSAGE